MQDSTRRNFLIASGAGAAAVGVAAALPTTGSASTPKQVTAPDDASPLVAHISDPRTGELSLLVGDREFVVHDPDLVGRITRAAAAMAEGE
jgi:hypothetical protein